MQMENKEVNKTTGFFEIEFEKPFKYEDKTFERMGFDYNKLTGQDLINIEKEMTDIGEYALSPEISPNYLARLAAKAGGVSVDVITALPLKEFNRIKNSARDFLAGVA